jgi:hypothetical protein
MAMVVLLGGASRLHAQNSAELLARGMRSSQNLDYDSAASFLRAALAKSGADALPDTSRNRALMFLGATEFFRDHRDSAAAVFTRLLVRNPRYRPDDLIFPPEVASLFQDVRSGLRAVAIRVAPVTEINGPGDRLAVELYATSLHEINAGITRAAGGPVRTIYHGAIGDSLQILWDGRDSSGAIADSGAYLLRVSSRDPSGRVTRVVEVPLDLRTVRRDTLPWPPPMSDSLLLPEQRPGGGGGRALVTGLAAAAVTALLPAVMANGVSGSGTRFVVVAAAGAAGVFGFNIHRHTQSIPANIAQNQALRSNWQRRMDTVRSENAARRGESHLVIRAGTSREGRP